jgi:hypothetical protein
MPMRATSMIVMDEALKVSVQATFVEYDHGIQTFAANGADHTFHVRTPHGDRGEANTCLILASYQLG